MRDNGREGNGQAEIALESATAPSDNDRGQKPHAAEIYLRRIGLPIVIAAGLQDREA